MADMEKWKEVEWNFAGRRVTDDEIETFEKRLGAELHTDHKWFLKNVVNGGAPVKAFEFATSDCPGGAAYLQLFYGVDRDERAFDLGVAIDAARRAYRGGLEEAPLNFIPIGQDGLGGEICINVSEKAGQIWYNPNDPNDVYYFSAPSLMEFLDSLAEVED